MIETILKVLIAMPFIVSAVLVIALVINHRDRTSERDHYEHERQQRMKDKLSRFK